MNEGYLKVGVTRSGRDVLISFVDNIETQIDSLFRHFDVEELFDVYAVLEFLVLKEFRASFEESDKCQFLELFARKIYEYLDVRQKIVEQRKLLNIYTSIDIIVYARSLLSSEYL